MFFSNFLKFEIHNATTFSHSRFFSLPLFLHSRHLDKGLLQRRSMQIQCRLLICRFMSKGPQKLNSLVKLLLNDSVILWQISMAKMRPQMVVVLLITLHKYITNWDPPRKFNLWIRPLSNCLECGGGGKKNQVQLLVNDWF